MKTNIKFGLLFRLKLALIFFICCAVYLANGVTISSGDTVPNSLLAFNLLENHTLSFDAFRTSHFYSDTVWFFVETNNGQLGSTYPIGSAIVTFPLYIIFYAYLKFIYSYSSVPLDITSVNFEVHRLFFEKLAATITTAISVVIFYSASRLKFNRWICLISTFIFAFATNTWVTSSQGLWQHGISNLVLLSLIFCLLKANRTSAKSQKRWLILAGLACGLLPCIRPTSILFSVAAIIYSVFIYRFKSIFLLFGLVSIIPSLIWNLYYFGNLNGGYSKMFINSPYLFTLNNFLTSSFGILFSSGRGLIFFSPIVLYSLPGAYRVYNSRSGKDEQLIGSMSIASIILISSYFFYIVWDAGWSYGPRFMTDIMPIACYLINYYCADLNNLSKQPKKNIVISFIFISLIGYSTFTQMVGAFGTNPGFLWNGIPLNIVQYPFRHWEFRDSIIERHTKAVLNKIIKLPIDNQVYINGLSGSIKKITDQDNHLLNSLISVKVGSEKILKANITNTGVSRWFGYESAFEKGEVRLRGRFYNTNNQSVKEVRLFVSGTPKQNETTNAIGSIAFPQEPGKYKLSFDFVAEALSEFPKINDINQPYDLTAIVEDNRIFSQKMQILKPIKYGKVGETVKIPITLNNTSNFLWNHSGANPVNFSYHWLDSQGKIIVYDGLRTSLPANLPSLMYVTVNASIKFPEQPGKYTLILTMVKENVAWFNQKKAETLAIPVEVINR